MSKPPDRKELFDQLSQYERSNSSGSPILPGQAGRDGPSSGRISIKRADRGFGFRLHMDSCVHGTGLGSTGSDLISLAMGSVGSETGGELPPSIDYLMIDAATREGTDDASHFLGICPEGGAAVGGSGTNPNFGYESYEACADRILKVLREQLSHLNHTDPRAPAKKGVEESCRFIVAGGAGGTSGGALIRHLQLLQQAADGVIKAPTFEVILICPDVAMLDTSRSVAREQKEIIRDTMFLNLSQLVHDLYSGKLCSQITLVDRTNGAHTLSTVADCISMIAQGLMATTVTAAGKFLADRLEDHHKTGATGWNRYER